MSTEPAYQPDHFNAFEQIRFGREILKSEGDALLKLSTQIGPDFALAANLVYECSGSIILTGMGKAGLVAQKIVATLASTGSPSHFLHPAEAIHGDLGRITQKDIVLALSNSGTTEEVVRLLPLLAKRDIPLIAMTAHESSPLGKAATVVLELGAIQEACALGLAPTTSTTAMIGMGDALALVVSRMKGFAPHDFAQFHPGGNLGKELSRVEEIMRPLNHCRVARDQQSVREVFINVSQPGRRSGAIMLIDDEGKLTGIFTDSDLARLFEQRQDQNVDLPISELMIKNPATVSAGLFIKEAKHLMANKKISELPVLDSLGCPIGLIDITDLVSIESKK